MATVAERNRPRGPTGGLSERRSLLPALSRETASKAAVSREAGLRFMEWSLRLPEPKAGTLNFDRFPHMRELYEEGFEDDEIIVKKASQAGASAWSLRWVMAHADRFGRTGLYIFPTSNDVYDFSDARIKKVIEASDYLQGRIAEGAVQNKGLREIGLGLIYFRGSESKSGAQSVDADTLVLDEYDLLDPENLPDLEQRIQGPLSASLIRRLGNPSVPEWGIAKAYAESDHREWRLKCGSCREYQTIDYGENVDEKRVLIVCRKCTKPLDLTKGEWVPKYPDRSTRGYHLSRLMIPSTVPGRSHNLEEVIERHHQREPYRFQVHMNKDLGLEWAPAEGRLTKKAIAAAQSAGGGFAQEPGYSGNNFTTMGVDVASARNLHVRVSELLPDGRRRGICIQEVEDFNEVALMIDRFRVNVCLVDSMPERRMAGGLVQRFPGRVWLIGFSQAQKQVLHFDADTALVTVKRVEALDAMIEQVRAQRNLLPLDLPEGYVEHMQAPVRVVEEDDTGKRVVYYRSTGQDDFAFAETYDLVAHEVFLILQQVESSQAPVLTTLDDHLEFERAALDPDSLDYRPGPAEPDAGSEWD